MNHYFKVRDSLVYYTILPVEDLTPNHKVLKPGPSPLQALIRAGLGLGLDGLGSAGSGLEARPSTSLICINRSSYKIETHMSSMLNKVSERFFPAIVARYRNPKVGTSAQQMVHN